VTAVSTDYTDNDVLVVSFSDVKILDEGRIEQVGKELMELPKLATGRKMLLDFRGVKFMSSLMIGKIIILQQECKSMGIVMKVCNMSDDMRKVFKITKLKIDIQKDRENAIASFDKKGWFS
jgi:anti-sigma B factor antagonist